MINQELLNYIKGEVAKGKSLEEIKNILLSAGGWSNEDLFEAFQSIAPTSTILESLRSNLNSKDVESKTSKQGCFIIGLKIIGVLVLLAIIAGGIFYWYFKNKLANYLSSLPDDYTAQNIPEEKDLQQGQIGLENENDLTVAKEETKDPSNTQIVSFEDFPDLILSGKDYECTMVMEKKVSDAVNLTLTTKSYISKNKSSGSMNISMGYMSFSNNTIADGQYLYTWGSITGNKGKKYKLNSEENPELIKNYVDQFKYNYSQVPEGNKVPDLNCEEKSIDSAKFIPPTNIEFTLTEMPKTIPKSLKLFGI